MPESAAERLVGWLWEDERLTAGLDDIQAGSLLQWASRRILAAAAQADYDQQELRRALRSVFSSARHVLPVTEDLIAWADRQLDQLLQAAAPLPTGDEAAGCVSAVLPTPPEPPATLTAADVPELGSQGPEQDERTGDVHG